MTMPAIETEAADQATLERTIQIFHAEEGSSEAHELDILLLLVKDYEDRHFVRPAFNEEKRK